MFSSTRRSKSCTVSRGFRSHTWSPHSARFGGDDCPPGLTNLTAISGPGLALILLFSSRRLSRREILLRIECCFLFQKTKSSLDLGGFDGFDVSFDHARKLSRFGGR